MGLRTKVKENLLAIPPVYAFFMRRRFQVERSLLEGELKNDSKRPSIIHFSVNKSATQYVKSIMCRCGAENGLIPVNMADYCFITGMKYFNEMSEEEFAKYAHVFRPQGFVYSVFGGLVKGIDQIDRYRIVLVIRDPRDVLVSHFYSVGFSHGRPPNPKHAARIDAGRRLARSVSIDDFVLERADLFKGRYIDYAEHLLGRPNVHLSKYEDMIEDFPSWLDSLLEFCDLEVSDRTRSALVKSGQNSVPRKENIHSHRRQVVPGDHKRKLKPETIETLNADFADVLKAFDYDAN